MIIAIGGGEFRQFETCEIDQFIVKSVKKSNPNLLFIPTASGDAEGYIEIINEIFGLKLGCNVRSLCLNNDAIENSEIDNLFIWSDIIYVGGGNTRAMIKKWKEYGIDKQLKNSFNENKILCGISAGSICWYEFGVSDSNNFDNEQNRDYCIVEGLGFIKGIHSPHNNERILEEKFIRFMAELNDEVIAIENKCAIVYDNDKITTLKSDVSAKAFKIKYENEKINEIEIE